MLLCLGGKDPAGGLRILVRDLNPKAADGAPECHRELVGKIRRNAAIGQQRAQDRGLLDRDALRNGGHWARIRPVRPSTPSPLATHTARARGFASAASSPGREA